jgi:hypothetical protein
VIARGRQRRAVRHQQRQAGPENDHEALHHGRVCVGFDPHASGFREVRTLFGCRFRPPRISLRAPSSA